MCGVEWWNTLYIRVNTITSVFNTAVPHLRPYDVVRTDSSHPSISLPGRKTAQVAFSPLRHAMRHRIRQTQAWRSNGTAGGTGSGKPRHGEAIKPQESESFYVKVARVSRHSTTINSNPFTLGRNLKGTVQDKSF